MHRVLLLLIISLVMSVPATAFAEHTPDWIEKVSELFVEGKISKLEFLDAISFLIQNKIIERYRADAPEEIIHEITIAKKYFEVSIDYRADIVKLFSLTPEIHTMTKFLEYRKYDNIKLDEDFIREIVTKRFNEFAKSDTTIDQVRFIDRTGMKVIRINNDNGTLSMVPKDSLQNKSKRYYFSESLQLDLGEVYISPIDLNVEHGKVGIPHKPTIRISTPVILPDGTKTGFLIVNYNASDVLDTVSGTLDCNMTMFDHEGTVIASKDKSLLFGKNLGTNISYYELHPEFEEHEENDELKYYIDEKNDSIIFWDTTQLYHGDMYWHFVCEVDN